MSDLVTSTALVPQARSITAWSATGYTLSPATEIQVPAKLQQVAYSLRSMLSPATGFALPITVAERQPGAAAGAGISFEFDPELADESFRLRSETSGVLITAGSEAGAFYGAQALRQLLPPAIYRRATTKAEWLVPGVLIDDAPKFGWRGLLVDVARHFLPKSDLLRLMDLAAMHRINKVHLHLTDDQGWRIEINAYPGLTEIGSWRRESRIGFDEEAPGDGRPHGGFYTKDDLREIVAYAAQRHITIVPEVDFPGHVESVLAAYPQFGPSMGSPDGAPYEVRTRAGISTNVLNTNDSTLKFVRDVFDEVMDIFPSRHIGIGGDECPKDQWRSDPETQARKAELGLQTEEELQSWFIRQITDHLAVRGRVGFGWDEVLEGGLTNNLVVASWRGLTGAREAARAGIDAVSCPCNEVYLDYRQSEDPNDPIPLGHPNTMERIFNFDPIPPGLTESEAQHILGGQGTMWTEQRNGARDLDFMLFPRLCALADALWSGPDSDGTAMARLERHLVRLDAIGVEYRALTGAKPWQRQPAVAGWTWTREEHGRQMATVTANIANSSQRLP